MASLAKIGVIQLLLSFVEENCFWNAIKGNKAARMAKLTSLVRAITLNDR